MAAGYLLAGSGWARCCSLERRSGCTSSIGSARRTYENEHTEAFLRGAGVDPDVTGDLRNADSSGRSVGPALVGLAARLGIAPTQMLDFVSSLPTDKVLQLAEAAHGIDPMANGRLPVAIPQLDAQVGQGGLLDRPHSIEGLRIFLVQNGFTLPRPIGTAS